MSDRLVKRLRAYAKVAHAAAAWGFAGEGFTMEKAADRIEELETMLGEVYTISSKACDRIEELEAENARLREALEFYANPETYHAVAFMCDRPGGGWEDDFDESHGHEFYERPMPGMKARAALKETDQ